MWIALAAAGGIVAGVVGCAIYVAVQISKVAF